MYKAFQHKCCYQILAKEEVEFDEDDDDALILALQPFDTVMSIGYGHLLTHKPVKFVARRSDIIVSSTLSITLTPADSDYRVLDKALLTPDQTAIWCDKRCEYRGMNVQVANLDFREDPDILLTQFVTPLKAAKTISLNRGATFLTKSVNKSSQYSPSPDLRKLRTEQIKDFGNDKELKFNQQMIGPRQSLIPPTLLTKPLSPELINRLSEEEKRLY